MSLISPYDYPIEIACDGCGFVLETKTTDFKRALKLMKQIYWKLEGHHDPITRKTQWFHYCSECRPQ